MSETDTEVTPENNEEREAQEYTENQLRDMFGEILDEKLSYITGRLDKLEILDSISELLSNKGEGDDPESLLSKISDLFDEKLKNATTSGGNGKKETPVASEGRQPKIRIFG